MVRQTVVHLHQGILLSNKEADYCHRGHRGGSPGGDTEWKKASHKSLHAAGSHSHALLKWQNHKAAEETSDCLGPGVGEDAVEGGAGTLVVNILCSDCTNVSILAETLSCVTSGKLGEKHRSLCIIPYNCL